MSTTASIAPHEVGSGILRRVVVASGLGTLLEYFDYASYSYLATTLATVFFPTGDRTVALLNTFAVFALSFLVRPFGALLWGFLGDRLGRKRILTTTILLMSGSTFLIGFIPGYTSIGMAAPALLLLLRVTQSFSAAGEYAGASTFIAEYAPDKRRGFLTGMVSLSSGAGFLVASLLATVLYAMVPGAAMDAWGWRIPFLIAGPLGLIGLYMRLRLEDTPLFREIVEKEQAADRAARAAAGRRRRLGQWSEFVASLPTMGKLLLVMALNAGGYYLLLSYIPTFLIEEVKMSQSDSNLVVTIALVVYLVIVPTAAFLSDRFGRRRALITSSVALIVLSYPLMALFSLGGVLMATIVLVVFLAIFSLNDAVFPAFFAESFATRSRYVGFAVPFNVGALLFGGVAPYVATWLIRATGNPNSPAFVLIAVAALSLVGLLLSRETAKKPLPDDPRAE
jgi:Sugar phosphate permease